MTKAYIGAEAALVCSQVWVVNANSTYDFVWATFWFIWSAILFLVDKHVAKG